MELSSSYKVGTDGQCSSKVQQPGRPTCGSCRSDTRLLPASTTFIDKHATSLHPEGPAVLTRKSDRARPGVAPKKVSRTYVESQAWPHPLASR
jgi:hypothetical protein